MCSQESAYILQQQEILSLLKQENFLCKKNTRFGKLNAEYGLPR